MRLVFTGLMLVLLIAALESSGRRWTTCWGG
jgi:hypothetical protein